MKIHAITVCVDYADKLAQSIERWGSGLASLTIVTELGDEDTTAVGLRARARLAFTDVFWRGGALFNKGLAIEEARRRYLPPRDWHLFLDADVVPPEDWLAQLEAFEPQASMLYGARRIYPDGRPIRDPELAGFFQLFHSSDPRAKAPLATNFYHAGNYDSDFISRWPLNKQRILPLTLVHLGEPRRNWCGVGNDAAMERLRRERREGKSWRQETIKP